MKQEIITQFLNSKGKYFPPNKLELIGSYLETRENAEYKISRFYWNPLPTTLIMILLFGFFTVFIDRLILKDWFWGFIKLLIPLLVLIAYLIDHQLGVDIKHYTSLEFIFLGIIALYLLWLQIDIFTLFSRIRKANYRKLLKALNIKSESGYHNYTKPSKKRINVTKNNEPNLIGNSNSSSLSEWRKKHPNASINDFYKK